MLASFEGEDRAVRALAAASEVLDRAGGNGEPGDAGEDEAPVAAMAAGRAVTGPVAWGEQAERALVGLPVQQLESLLREATAGELLLSREVHEELDGSFERAGYRLAERRGVDHAAAALRPEPARSPTDWSAPPARGRRALRTLAGAAGRRCRASRRAPCWASGSRSSPCWARAAWASSTRRATASSTTSWPSRC